MWCSFFVFPIVLFYKTFNSTVFGRDFRSIFEKYLFSFDQCYEWALLLMFKILYKLWQINVPAICASVVFMLMTSYSIRAIDTEKTVFSVQNDSTRQEYSLKCTRISKNLQCIKINQPVFMFLYLFVIKVCD